MKIKKYLVSFGSPNLKLTVKRFLKQGNDINYFDKIIVFSINDLDISDKKKLAKLLQNKKNKKGYGFWFWKPLIIKKLLKKINNNDIVNYVDLGCHINPRGKKRLDYYIKKLNKSKKGMLCFQYKKLPKLNNTKFKYQNIYEYKYTKADLFHYFDVFDKKDITQSAQYWAGNIILKKNTFTKKFIDSWLNVFIERFDLVDDTKSKNKNFKNFVKNKSDQSIFSLLCKINKVNTLSAYECEWIYYKKKRYWGHTLKSPIIAKRDKKFT